MDGADELYQVPLAEFTKARDAAAARLSAAGDKPAAAELKRAKKPSIPAWAANQVVWRAPEAWQRLREAAKGVRRAYQKAPSPDEVREATREQRDALADCEARASQMLAEHGHAATPPVLEKVGHALLALAYGAPDVTPGRLETDLPPPGFEALAGLTLAPLPRPPAVPSVPREEPKPEPRDTAEEKRALEQERSRQQAARKAAEARQAESRRAVVRARARLESDEKRLHAIEGQLEAARRDCEDARRQLEAAEAEDRAAEAAVDALRQPEARVG